MNSSSSSSSWMSLPIEIILQIRSFLFSSPHIYLNLCSMFSCGFTNRIEKDNIFIYNEIENRRSWREFLSVRNDEYWRYVRKHTFSMALGRYYSLKFLTSRLFRDRVENVIYQRKQISLILEKVNYEFTEADSAILSGLQTVHLALSPISSLPHIHDVDCLNLRSCGNLLQIKKLSRIHTLFISDCRALSCAINKDVVELDNRLSRAVYFEGDKDCIFPTVKVLRTNVPGPMFTMLERFIHLEELLLDRNFPRDENDVSKLPALPSLKLLSLLNVTVEDISHLYSLTSLTLFGTSRIIQFHPSQLQGLRSLTISSSNFLYDIQETQFKSLPYDQLSSLKSTTLCPFTSYLSNVENLKYLDFSYSTGLAFSDPKTLSEMNSIDSTNFLSIGEKVKVLSLSDCDLQEIPPMNPDQSFLFLDLAVNPFIDVSPLSMKRIHYLKLFDCQNIQDIEPIKHIPYLSFINCRKINSFSCLGQYQQFLDLTGCLELEDHHLSYLKDIPCLIISRCPLITDIQALTNNLYLGLLQLYVENYQFFGKNYRQVHITPGACRINVSAGKIDMLVLLSQQHPSNDNLPTIEGIENILAIYTNNIPKE